MELRFSHLVDSFLASLHLLPKWRLGKDDEQEGSLFWKYICVLIKQLDQIPRNNRCREDVVDPTDRCVQIRLGEKQSWQGLIKELPEQCKAVVRRAESGTSASRKRAARLIPRGVVSAIQGCTSAKIKRAGLNTWGKWKLIWKSKWRFKVVF
jgi:hypothetical protein